MCSYCGCDSLTPIDRFSAEHEDIINATGEMRRAAETGDRAATMEAAHRLTSMIGPHVESEERSLFAELRTNSEFTDHIAALCSEHRTIAATLARVCGGDLGSAAALEDSLRVHIDKEENGLFPAAAIALDGPAWTQVAARA